MLRGIQFIAMLLVSIISIAQVSFEKGYFIDVNGNKTTCLIKNLRLYENPESFKYKLEGSSELQTITLDNAIEVGIEGEIKYERHLVEIDYNSDELNALDQNFNEESQKVEKQVFLRKIVEGEFNLYDFVEGNIQKFFVSNSEVSPRQLTYKVEKVNGGIASSGKYRGQLNYFFNCNNISTKNLTYSSGSIIGYIKRVYKCKNSPYTIYKKKGVDFNIKLKGGYRISNLVVDTERNFQSVSDEFTESGGPIFGFEAELGLPFFNNRLSLPINFMYHSSSFEKINSVLYPQDHTFILDYSSLEAILALRYNLPLGKKSTIGLSTGLAFDVFSNDTNEVRVVQGGTLRVLENEAFTTKSTANLVFGLNYTYDKKYFAEVNYSLDRDLSKNQPAYNVQFSYINFVVGYTIFSMERK